MITIRKAAERGAANHGWLDTRHTFSFADYYDPAQLGFRALRVINEDRVKPGMGFGTHGHQDMEILSVVLEGELAHQDSMGTGSVIKPGDVQRMSAGSGVRHSEFNASKDNDVHFLQIWLVPDRKGVAPSYAEKRFPPEVQQGKLALIASPDGAQGSLSINADVKLYGTVLAEGQQVTLPLAAARHAWVHVAKGEVELNGQRLQAGDGAAISGESAVELRGHGGEALVFDLA